MKNLIVFIFLFTICSCSSRHCTECVETEHTIMSTSGLENLSIYSANIVTEYDTYFRVAISNTNVEWTSASFRMYNGNTTLIDLAEEIQWRIEANAINGQTTFLTIPIEGINDEGKFPEDEVFFEGTLSSAEHQVSYSGSTHFYICDNVSDDFSRIECRYSCQIGSNGFSGEDCSGFGCPF